MDVGNLLKLDITLQKLSTAVVAVNLWELKSVKNTILEVFNSGCKFTIGSKDKDQIFDYVIELVTSLGVPEKLSEEIKNYVYIIGGLIFDFMEHITKNGIDVAFAMNICWAPYGRIDEVKMCRGFLKNSSEGQALEDDVLCLARIYTDINLVGPNMRKIQKKFKESKKSSFDIFQHCFENDDLHFAARYFWRELDIMEKQNIVVECAQKFLRVVLNKSIHKYQYVRQMKTELLVFFMGEMSEIQLSDFITKNYTGLFEAFLKSWPHQELCENIIALYNNVNDGGGFYMGKCFDLVLSIFTRLDDTFRTYKHKNVFNCILQMLLDKSPDKLKQKYFFEESINCTLNIFWQLATRDYWIPLSTILNDGSLKGLKKDVVYGSEITKLMRNFVLIGHFKFANNFCKYVLSTEEEIKLFKRKIDWINRLASEGNIKGADWVLNWLCDTEKERKEKKEEVHSLEVGKFIVKREYDIAEEFVNWRYDSEEERKNAKKMLYGLDRRDPLEYCTDLFHKMEFTEINQYFTWRYSEEEDRKNIRKALRALDEDDPKVICENLIDDTRNYCYNQNIENARFYLELRFETEEERQDLKKRLYKPEKYLLEEYLLEKCHELLIHKNPLHTMNFHRTDYLKCFKILKFFLETAEAVVEFETNNIFTEEFFLKHTSDMPFKNFEEFLQFWDDMRKEINMEKKYIS